MSSLVSSRGSRTESIIRGSTKSRNHRNLSIRFQFYFWYVIENIQNVEHVLDQCVKKRIFTEKEIQHICHTNDEISSFTRSYNSLRKAPRNRPASIVSVDKQLQLFLMNEFENKALKIPTLFVQAVMEKLKIEDLTENDENTFQELVSIFHDTQNGFIAELLYVDPDRVPIGMREWEKIVLELWGDFIGFVDYDAITPFLLQQNVITQKQHMHFRNNLRNNADRVAHLLLLLSDCFKGLYWLIKALQNQQSVRYNQLAQLCTLLSTEDATLFECHKNFILSHMYKPGGLVEKLQNSGGINLKDKKRIMNSHITKAQMKEEMLRTLSRKRPGIINLFMECCRETGHEDIAIVLTFKPELIPHWDEVAKLIHDWEYLTQKVSYEDIYQYFIHRGFISQKEHQVIQKLPQNSDKIRKVLAKLPTRQGAYEALFQILTVQPKYEKLIQRCLTMDFEESSRILEVQDFLWEHLTNIDQIIEKLIADEIMDNQQANSIMDQPTHFDQNLALTNTLKHKGPGTVDKLVEILWMTDNRNSAEILSVDFRKLQMTTEEWTKWKVYWCQFVQKIRYKNIASVLLETNVITLIEHQWILKSEKNRQRMRKLLRIIPAKQNGYRSFLSAISTVTEPEYQKLLFQCQPLSQDNLNKFYVNYEFLLKNTKHLNALLKDLEDRKIITSLQTKIINCYNENSQTEEFYLLLLGKEGDIFHKIIESLLKSGNTDAAVILNIDLTLMTMTMREWKALKNQWNNILDIVDYYEIRENCIQLFLDSKEDEEIIYCSNGPDMMRMLLQIISYKKEGFRHFICTLMKYDNYQCIAWKLMTSEELNTSCCK